MKRVGCLLVVAAVAAMMLVPIAAVQGEPIGNWDANCKASPPFDGDGNRDPIRVNETGDESHHFKDAVDLDDGTEYRGHLDRVTDRADYFTVTAAQHQVVNAHVHVLGHDGTGEWVRPRQRTPPEPPAAPHASCVIDAFLYHQPGADYPLDGAYNYYYVRDYVLNACAPVPGTHDYLINLSLNWYWTPNNYTWDYVLTLEVTSVPELAEGDAATGTIDLATRDTRWFRVRASAGHELNGSLEVLNFNTADPTERDVNLWVVPDDLGGYPRAIAWDWSAAPNEPVEPFSVLATYDGYYYLKLRGMNHVDNLPCTYRLEVHTQPVPEYPETGVESARLDRERDDTDWYRFEMEADQRHPTKPGLWNEVTYFNMTERADSEDLPDFDLYLFGRVPGTRDLDLLDSSFRNDHSSFLDPDRDPNRNTEHVYAASYYNGTYYLEVNAFNNSGFYDLRRESKTPRLSDTDNIWMDSGKVVSGVYSGHVHQAFDHRDWYKLEAKEYIRIQLDTSKMTDLFCLQLNKYDIQEYELVRIAEAWNLGFNLTSREDELTNLVEIKVRLADMGLGAGTYYFSVTAAAGADFTVDEDGRVFVYKNDRSATSNYELRIWVDDGNPIPPPPRIRRLIPDTTVKEDTDLIDYLDLYDYFVNTDVGDQSLRFRATIQHGKLKVLIQEGDTLGFLAAEDYTGKVVVRVTAIDRRFMQTSLMWNITFTPVEDPPRLAVHDLPFEWELPEDSLRMLDLGELVLNVDEGDHMSVDFATPEHLSIEVDPDTLVARVHGAPDWHGEETVTFVFEDLAGLTAELPVRFVVTPMPDTPRLVSLPSSGTIDEDGHLDLYLADFVVEPDGEELSVTVGVDEHIIWTYEGASSILRLEPDEDWSGESTVVVTALDPTGREVSIRFHLDVQPVNDPPVITSWAPRVGVVRVDEGSQATLFLMSFEDPDSTVHFLEWHVDGTFAAPGWSFTYRPGADDVGGHEVVLTVTDEAGDADTVAWMVVVEDVPHPPEGGIATPPDGSTFDEGEPIDFVAMYIDRDGDPLTYSWLIDGLEVSDRAAFATELDEGRHQVTLHVTSDGEGATSGLELTVDEGKKGTATAGLLALAALGAMAVTSVSYLLWRRSR